MPQFATVVGHVTYTPGDGVPLPIPKGRIEVDLSAPDSAIISWEADNNVVGLTAMPRTQFDEYVEDEKIRLEG